MPAVGLVANGKKLKGNPSHLAGLMDWYICVGLSTRLNEDKYTVSVSIKILTDGAGHAYVLFERCRKARKANQLQEFSESSGKLVSEHA